MTVTQIQLICFFCGYTDSTSLGIVLTNTCFTLPIEKVKHLPLDDILSGSDTARHSGGPRQKRHAPQQMQHKQDKHTAGELHSTVAADMGCRIPARVYSNIHLVCTLLVMLSIQQTAATANSPVPAEKAGKRNPEVAFVPKSKRKQERH